MTKFTMEPSIETKWKIGHNYYGLTYYVITAQCIQHRFVFRLVPLDVVFEFVNIGKWKKAIGIEITIFFFKIKLGFEI